MHRRIRSKPLLLQSLNSSRKQKASTRFRSSSRYSFIKQNKFRYENLATLSEILSEEDYFTTFDQSSGYHHIEIHPGHRKIFGFEWTFEDGSTKYFHFCVLPFGLSSACYVFTKVLHPFTKRWRGIGIKAIIYIDDGIAATRSFEIAKTAGELVKKDLVSAGFVINVEKSDLNPKTKGRWLGTIIDTIEMTFTVPSEKINKLLADIKNIFMQNVLTPKQLAKITATFIYALSNRTSGASFYKEPITK